jgi:hypothetical protein
VGSFRFGQSAVYRIEVAGHLDEGWAECLRDMTIENHVEADAAYATVTGYLPDQAALFGVLNALYDGHIAVLAVESLTEA